MLLSCHDSGLQMALEVPRKRKSTSLEPCQTPPLYTTPPLFTPWTGDPTSFTALTARRRGLLRRTSSFSSASSVTSGSSLDDLAGDVPWTHDELARVEQAYAEMLEHARLDTPFVGPPPSQLTHNVARALCRDKAWKHSLKATRAKIIESAKDVMQWKMDVEETPMQRDAEETPRRSKRLARQDSSDILPTPSNGRTLARLSQKLQRGDSSDSEHFHRMPLTRHHTIADDPSIAYPSPIATPQRGSKQALRRATSMALEGRPVAGLERSNSTSAATSSGPDMVLYGATPSPIDDSLRSQQPQLSTPFEPAYPYGLRPKRTPLIRRMSGLSIHPPLDTEVDEEAPMADSPLSSSPTSSLLRSSISSSTTSGSVHDLDGFLDPDYVLAGQGRKSV